MATIGGFKRHKLRLIKKLLTRNLDSIWLYLILLYLWIRINSVMNCDVRITLPAKRIYLKNEIGIPSNNTGDSMETDSSCRNRTFLNLKILLAWIATLATIFHLMNANLSTQLLPLSPHINRYKLYKSWPYPSTRPTLNLGPDLVILARALDFKDLISSLMKSRRMWAGKHPASHATQLFSFTKTH